MAVSWLLPLLQELPAWLGEPRLLALQLPAPAPAPSPPPLLEEADTETQVLALKEARTLEEALPLALLLPPAALTLLR